MDSTVQAPLGQWLRLLWGNTPALHLNSQAPFIADGEIHLPACGQWRQHRAAAAHAAAHLVFSPQRFDGSGLAPAARALLALLEDARAEALAVRELPGLARLWRPLHSATPADGATFEALMSRLARALVDPSYDDPHPWVRKGHGLFFLDGQVGLLALRTPTELRRAATRLGHDIGQMRLPFNSRTYRPVPAYRDDHRWMWAADELAAVQPPAPQAADHPEGDESVSEEILSTTQHPEWDRLIGRLRQDWCTVIETVAAAPAEVSVARPPGPDAALLALSRRLRTPLRALLKPRARRRRSTDGEIFDTEALVHWRLAVRLRIQPDPRVYLGLPPPAAGATVWLLVDRSASTAEPHGRTGRSVLQVAVYAAAALALALQSAGVTCGVAGFSSYGRHAVRMQRVKHPDEPLDGAVLARLHALRPAGSTRVGAALRQAAAQLAGSARAGAGARWVLLLSDGQPHDVDVHDARYLVADARHAVLQSGRGGVRMACLSLAGAPTGGAASDALRIFGRHGVYELDEMASLPRGLRRLLG